MAVWPYAFKDMKMVYYQQNITTWMTQELFQLLSDMQFTVQVKEHIKKANLATNSEVQTLSHN